MTLAAGSRLGPYEILSPLGAGGMGEVYRARDTRLDRDVAVKVLSPLLAESPEALARFEREAKAVAALSHANIVALYDFGQSGGTLYAVSELLEGETLRSRLAEEALPARKASEIATQVAQGLAAAHEKGIVHRDLKPENVFLTKAGPAKILDFGLAQQSPLARAGEDTRSPTVARATDPGTVLGTVGYMSPEQVRGKPADHRSDIFSFGALLYEMLSGRRAFQRESPAETMSAIAREDPPELSGISPGLDRIVHHCLEKDPAERFQSARDLAFDLASGSTVSVPQKTQPAESARASRRWLVIAAAIALLAVGIAADRIWTLGSRNRASARSVRYTQLTEAPGAETSPRLSPDGGTLLYVSSSAGNDDIWSVRVGGHNAVNLTADSKDDDWAPAFSFDGKQIAFRSERAGGGVFVMEATGESVRRLTDFGYDPAWSPDGKQIVVATEGVRGPYSRLAVSELWVVSVADSSRRLLSKGDAVRPAWSPDGKRIAYVRVFGTGTNAPMLWTIPAAGPADVGALAIARVGRNDVFPTWSGDGRYLYFSSDRSGPFNIWRVAIDSRSGEARGQPETVTVPALDAESPTVSRAGDRLAYESLSNRSTLRRLAFDATLGTAAGPAEDLWSSSRMIVAPRFSPDGSLIVMGRRYTGKEDLVLAKLDGSGLRQLTESDLPTRNPRFSPDGKRVAFYSARGNGTAQIWEMHADGSGLRQLSDFPGHDVYYPLYAPDGTRLEAVDDEGTSWLFDLAKTNAKWTVLHQAKEGEILPDANNSWSRDGLSLAGDLVDKAYRRLGIYVESVESGERRRLTESGEKPVWLSDNRRVLYLKDGALWLIDSKSGKTSEILPALKPPRTLETFDISPDEKFILLLEQTSESDIWLRSEE
jgi:eukaryotic-like serine/threonine-protein kinase